VGFAEETPGCHRCETEATGVIQLNGGMSGNFWRKTSENNTCKWLNILAVMVLL